ncbi:hypothetical protein Cpir12675_005222 [Ceratocystis pirilliformis]|uniref:Uncharacterized protein n=1 Tax=Ceratocystis pirilliformis TaxID=259994 RepID=A0ABR3YR45_9PEZI
MYGRGGGKLTSLSSLRHYSYECKTPNQERPYVPRPSRTQQLANPKLQPALQATLNDSIAERKQAAVDSELARREAERERKREREAHEEKLLQLRARSRSPLPKRHKKEGSADGKGRDTRRERSRHSRSSSVETISTNRSVSLVRRTKASRHSEGRSRGRSRSYSRSQSRSRSPPYRDSRTPSQSPSRSSSRGSSRSRSPIYTKKSVAGSRRRRSISPQRRNNNGRTGTYRERRSVSRSASLSLRRRPGREGFEQGLESTSVPSAPLTTPAADASRERSLSPYSKRLALTKAMQQR